MCCCACPQEDKLEPSEQLGDLLRSAGDADAALKCYRASGATTKVIEGMCLHYRQLQLLQLCSHACMHAKCSHETDLQTHNDMRSQAVGNVIIAMQQL